MELRRTQGKAVDCRGAEGWVTGNGATGRWKRDRSLNAKKRKTKLDLYETCTENYIRKHVLLTLTEDSGSR